MIKLPFSGSGFLLVFLQLIFQTTDTAHDCPASSCGGTNISYPFRLQTDPISCGDDKYKLSCENNVTVLHPIRGGKYHVKAINYDNFTIRLVDASVDEDNCSSIPSVPLTTTYFPLEEPPYTLYKYKQIWYHPENWYQELEKLPTEMICFIKCENAVNSYVYLDTSPCINSSLSRSGMYSYAYVGEMKAYDLRDGCSLEMVSLMLPRIEIYRSLRFIAKWHLDLSFPGTTSTVDTVVRANAT